MGLRWEAPPPAVRQGARKYEAEAEELRKRPGDWALIAEFEPDVSRKSKPQARANSLASNIKYGMIVAFKKTDDGRFEATSRGPKVYVRYVKDLPADS